MTEEREEVAVPEEKSSGNRRMMALLGLLVLMTLFIGVVVLITRSETGGELNTLSEQASEAGSDERSGENTAESGTQIDETLVSGRVLGSPEALVVIKDFSDFRCPHCQNAAFNLTPKIIEEYIKPGLVRLEFIPVVVTNEEGLIGGLAALCAEDQGKFWPYHDILFERQGEVEFTLESATSFANELGMDIEVFNDCMISSKYTDQLVENNELFTESGGTGTPTFLVNDQIVVGGVEFETVKELIEEKLKN